MGKFRVGRARKTGFFFFRRLMYMSEMLNAIFSIQLGQIKNGTFFCEFSFIT